MGDRQASLQDLFLNSARRSKIPLTVFLLKGVKLQGVITWFDAFSLLLRREGNAQLVYKHSISTVMPTSPLELPIDDLGDLTGARGLQDQFLSVATRDKEPMTVFLINGVMLQGSVVAHDQFSLMLQRGSQAQLVYKHAISTLQPERPLSLGPAADGPEQP